MIPALRFPRYVRIASNFVSSDPLLGIFHFSAREIQTRTFRARRIRQDRKKEVKKPKAYGVPIFPGRGGLVNPIILGGFPV